MKSLDRRVAVVTGDPAGSGAQWPRGHPGGSQPGRRVPRHLDAGVRRPRGQKLLAAEAIIDVPLALAIAGLRVLIAVAPLSVPGLTPPM